MKSLCKIFILAAVMCRLTSMVLPAAAAEPVTQADKFDLSFTLRFFNNGFVEEPLEAYQQNSFLLTDSSGWYLQAEYNADDNTYHLTGWTLEEAAATHLRCGQRTEKPGRISIMELPAGTYLLTQREVTEEYSLLSNPVEISVSTAGTEVNGQPVHNDSTNGTSSFFIQIIKPFPFPKLYSSTWQMIRESRSMQLVILAWASFVISAVFIITFLRKQHGNNRTHTPSL